MKNLLHIFFFISIFFNAQIAPVLDSDELKVGEPFLVKYELNSKNKWELPLLKKRDILQTNLEITKVTLDTFSEKMFGRFKRYHLPAQPNSGNM